jgi:glycine/D-amino acid oxidase-like deaminating enzyme
MSQIVIIGCGVVGAAIAYELSLIPGLSVTVLEQKSPAQGATGAALGVLMGVISHKIKGKAWQLRQTSLQRYETLIPELAAKISRQIPYNRQGILMLISAPDITDWQKLAQIRATQGWDLEIWDLDQIKSKCPHLNLDNISAAIYSPQDRQVEPTALTLALVEAAKKNGVTFRFGVAVEELISTTGDNSTPGICHWVKTAEAKIDLDWLILSAGLGSTSLTNAVNIQPVLGQALHVRLEKSIGDRKFQPVVTNDDIHIVPVGDREYWVGATVEFPNESGDVTADPGLLDKVMQGAIAFCPPLADAKILRSWSGLRPRPQGLPAPIIGQSQDFSNILLATGHYRNGVLLAPATALAIRDLILGL